MPGLARPIARDQSMHAVAFDADARLDERELDQVLADSFPASDPPPWTLGVTRAQASDLALRHEADRKAGEGAPVVPHAL